MRNIKFVIKGKPKELVEFVLGIQTQLRSETSYVENSNMSQEELDKEFDEAAKRILANV